MDVYVETAFVVPLTTSCFFFFAQAVRETALSRATLFGTTAALPNLLVLLLQRSVMFKQTCLSSWGESCLFTSVFYPQMETFPEVLSAGCSSTCHKCCICSGFDDPRLVQSLSTTGNGRVHQPFCALPLLANQQYEAAYA